MEEKSKTKYHVLEVLDTKYRTLLTKKYENRTPYAPKNPKLIHAFIPGVIKKVLVNEGDEVMAGDKLLVFDAMKMNNNIVAPIGGEILKVNVKAGDQVSKSVVLIEIK